MGMSALCAKNIALMLVMLIFCRFVSGSLFTVSNSIFELKDVLGWVKGGDFQVVNSTLVTASPGKLMLLSSDGEG
jgi:hypothetical protein